MKGETVFDAIRDVAWQLGDEAIDLAYRFINWLYGPGPPMWARKEMRSGIMSVGEQGAEIITMWNARDIGWDVETGWRDNRRFPCRFCGKKLVYNARGCCSACGGSPKGWDVRQALA